MLFIHLNIAINAKSVTKTNVDFMTIVIKYAKKALHE